ncbi:MULTISPECIES: Card1-like endonuclease domain-containing protein [Thermoanaerobacterium]|uniref:Card1 CARF domain-containing protein n=2 Tax=Thermoanaerobacterium TaxID=28895 RepID=W9EA28_9THEO|nr:MULTISPECIES: DUF1887 family CARF protein [Thermoanaerobacterium]AFK85855.1 hypothetical protein Tsac_0833 [Thermoanaerobacterium saccharolyticum JW/SL-YS485]ETO37936.1 hypothetical protein V518_1802 [Thermoanaerobacterium aotearoense SCUT27]
MGNKVLVLSVGTNPLPNYVVGSYLKEKYDKFVLIYSEENQRINQNGTGNFAKKLKEHLNLNDKYVFLPLSDVSDSKQIRKDLNSLFPNDNFEEIHLNYTGGTKTMVLHIYNFLREKFKNKFKGSYLDARDYKLVYDDSENTINLKDTVKIDINTLLSIHLYETIQFECYDTYSYKQKFMDSFNEMSQRIENAIMDNKGEDFIKWLENPFRKIFKGGDKLLEKVAKFKEHIKLLKDNNSSPIVKFNKETPKFIWDILNAFPEGKKLNDGQELWIPDDKITNDNLSSRVKDTVEFLDGKWLEWYVYKQIKSELLDRKLKEGEHFGLSLKAQKKDSPDFELDIFLINGYQLIGISLTTSSKKDLCKLKGFEVIHRARQIGGDESKAILITGMDKSKTEDLQNDLAYETGSTQKRFVVFGIDDWGDIGSKICKEVFE